eukprot:UN06228
MANISAKKHKIHNIIHHRKKFMNVVLNPKYLYTTT